MIAGTRVEECVMGLRSLKRVRPLGLVASLWSALGCSGSDAAYRPADGEAVGDASDTDSAIARCADPLTFADPDVEIDVRQGIGLPSGPIHAVDVAGLTDLDFETDGFTPCPAGVGSSPSEPCIDFSGPPRADGVVTSLAGVECLPAVRSVEVDPFSLDLTPLAALPNLAALWFGPAQEPSFPRLPQVTALHASVDGNTTAILLALPSLQSLELTGADFSTDAAGWALWALWGLTRLSVPRAGLVDTGTLSHLSRLTDIELGGNHIQDISALAALPALRSLDLSDNQISDLAPLLANPGLGFGSAVDVTGNPLDCSKPDVATLRARGVTVITDCP